MQDEIRKLRDDLKISANLDNVDFLSKIAIELSNLNIEIGLAAAQAKFAQEAKVISIMDVSAATDEKKISKTEAESRAIVDTENSYEALDNEREDLAELVNSLKKRLDVLGWDRKHS